MRWAPPPSMPAYTALSPAVRPEIIPSSPMRRAIAHFEPTKIPVKFWPAAASNQLELAEFDDLLYVDAAMNQTVVGPSSIPGAARALFATAAMAKGHRVLPVFGECVHIDLEAAAMSENLHQRNRFCSADCSPRGLSSTAQRSSFFSMELDTGHAFWDCGDNVY